MARISLVQLHLLKQEENIFEYARGFQQSDLAGVTLGYNDYFYLNNGHVQNLNCDIYLIQIVDFITWTRTVNGQVRSSVLDHIYKF